jgi:Mannose-6-phosphate isomerase
MRDMRRRLVSRCQVAADPGFHQRTDVTCWGIAAPGWPRESHTGPAPLMLVEVQHGDYFGEDDIVRLEDDYGRSQAGPSSAQKARLNHRRPRPGRPWASTRAV